MKFELKLAGKSLAAAVVLFLAMALALAGTIVKGTGGGPTNTSALVQKIVEEKDHVTPDELARWVIDKRQDYQLIDIRQPWQFDDYHIPTAVNIPLDQLFQDSGLKQLSREKKIVVYGLGAGHSAGAQLLLSMKGYNAYSLREGLTAWWTDVMTPWSIRSDQQSPAGYRQAKTLREFFMGTTAPGGARTAPAAPPPELPPAQEAPKTKPAPTNKLKLGRGCS